MGRRGGFSLSLYSCMMVTWNNMDVSETVILSTVYLCQSETAQTANAALSPKKYHIFPHRELLNISEHGKWTLSNHTHTCMMVTWNNMDVSETVILPSIYLTHTQKIQNKIHLRCRLLHGECISICTQHTSTFTSAHTHREKSQQINFLSLSQNGSHNQATR